MKQMRQYLRRKKLISLLIILSFLTSVIPTDRILAANGSAPTIQKHAYSYVGTSNLYTVRNVEKGYKISWSLNGAIEPYVSFQKDKSLRTKELTAAGNSSKVSVYTLAEAKEVLGKSYKVTVTVYDREGKKVAKLVDKVKISIDATKIIINNPPKDNKIVLGTSYNFNKTIQPKGTSNKTYWVVCDAEGKEILNTKSGKTSEAGVMKANGIFTPKVAGVYKITAVAYRDKKDTVQRSVSKLLEITVVAPTSASTPTPTPTVIPTNNAGPYIPPVTNPTPVPTSFPPIPDPTDIDGDGVYDDDEELYGTKIDNKDTDGDTLSDFIELFVLYTDPLTPEEDVESYKDPEKDTDGDGLSDWSEITEHYTFWERNDTDLDGLSDGEEINNYKTDPILKDTDGDGLSDGLEVAMGLDPKDPTDGSLKFEQSLSAEAIGTELLTDNLAGPSVIGYLSGNIDERVSLRPSGDATLLDTRSLIGKPVVIGGNEELFDGSLTLGFDMSALALIKGVDYLKNLMICKLSPDGSFLPVPSSVLRGTSLYCNPDAAGTYFVLDVAEFLTALGIDVDDFIPAPTASRMYMAEPMSPDLPPSMSNELPEEAEITIIPYSLETPSVDMMEVVTPSAISMEADPPSTISGQADIVFVIDTTGSMSGEISAVIRNITNFVTLLATEYDVQVNFALIDFKDLEEDGPDTTKVIKNGTSNWYSRVSDFITMLNTLRATGGGDTPESDVDALETARRLDWRQTASKFAILITDAPYKTYTSYGVISLEEEAARLKAAGIITSVITYTGEHTGTYDYSPLWKTTGGLFASIYDDFSTVLLTLAGMIGEETSDGVWVILKHGFRYIKLPALPENNGVDTDGDGVSDYNELGTTELLDLTLFIKAQLVAKGYPIEDIISLKSITVYNALSDPTMADTDGDGLNDGVDPNAWGYEVVPAIKENPTGTAEVQAQWTEVLPKFINSGPRSKLVYDMILDQFKVEDNIRYKKDTRNGVPTPGVTWCNIFVWDATIGMNVEIPHYYNPKTGAEAVSRKPGEYYEMSATRMTEWLVKFGPSFGWHEVSASEAQQKANAGLPTVAVAMNTNHVQMICPARGTDTATMAAQAGAVNYRYDPYTRGMGTAIVRFFYHN